MVRVSNANFDKSGLALQHDEGTRRSSPKTPVPINGKLTRAAAPPQYYGECVFESDRQTYVRSYASRSIEWISVLNESWYNGSSMAGSKFVQSPSGWTVQSLTAAVTGSAAGRITKIYGYHSFYEPGFPYTDIQTTKFR